MANYGVAVGVGPNDNPPEVDIDFSKTNLDEMTGFDVGDMVRVVVVGRIKHIEKRQDVSGKMGSMTLEYKSVDIKDAPNSDFAALVEDE